MQALSPIIVSFVTWGLTAITKDKFVGKKTKERKIVVRFLAAVFAILASLGAAYVNGGSFDVALVPVAVDSLIAMFASFGIYQVSK